MSSGRRSHEELERELADLRQRNLELERRLREPSIASQGGGSVERQSPDVPDECQPDLNRQLFLLAFSEAVRPVADASEILVIATRMLREHFDADHAIYSQMADDNRHYTILHDDHRPGLSSIAGRNDLGRSHPVFQEGLRNGRTIVTCDVFAEQKLTERQITLYNALRLAAFVTVPLVKAGRLVAFLRVQHAKPYRWSDSEVALIEEIAERTWAAVERAHAEETLHRNEQLMRTIIQSSSGLMYIKDRDSRVVFVNEAFGQAFHVDIRDMIGKNDYEMFPDHKQARQTIENDQLVMRTGETHVFEETQASPTGPVTYQLTKSPWRNAAGEIVGIVGTATNITERKRAEEALKDALRGMEARTRELNAIIASIPDSLIIYDRQMMPILINDEAQHFYDQVGIDHDQPFEQRMASARFMDEGGHPLAYTEMPNYRTLQTGETLRNFTFMAFTLEGQVLYFDASTAPIRDESGMVTGAIIVQRDITDLKRNEALLRESEQRATRLVEQLKEADQNKNRFISILSHELRNPLAAIVMSQDLLRHLPPGSMQGQRAMAAMERQTGILTHLVDDLLDVTRISENKITLKKELLDLRSVVQRTITDFLTAYERKSVHLRSELPSSPLVLEADPVRITQVVGNLLQNALKFTRAGDRVAVTVRTDAAQGEAVVEVADTGMGIEPAILAQLFQPFTQADRSLARTQGGLGLGLSIVKGMVELHGGRVQATSAGIGRGATFTIRLPLPVT